MTVMRTPTKNEAAAALRLAGASYDEVAIALNYRDAKAAARAVEAALAASATDEDREQLRGIVNRQYDKLYALSFAKANDPECAEQLSAIRVCRELLDRKVAVNGLAMPQEFVVHTPTSHELEQWVAKVSRSSLPVVIEADIFEAPAIDGEIIPGVHF